MNSLVIASLFALLQKGFGVVGVFKVAVAVVASVVAGDEVFTLVEAKPVGIGFQGQRLTGEVGRDGVAVGLHGDAELLGGS